MSFCKTFSDSLISCVDDDVPMRQYLDMHLGPNEDGEPAPAPKRSSELNWLLMKSNAKYMSDCQDHELGDRQERRRRERE